MYATGTNGLHPQKVICWGRDFPSQEENVEVSRDVQPQKAGVFTFTFGVLFYGPNTSQWNVELDRSGSNLVSDIPRERGQNDNGR